MGEAAETRIFEVRAESEHGKVHSFGACRTRDEAELLLRASRERVEVVGWRNDRYWIEEIDTTGLWQPPPQPTPRDRFTTRVTTIERPRMTPTVHVEVVAGARVVAEYDRNYPMLQTCEPFRQGERTFALVSTDYTATAVLDLDAGKIIATEPPAPDGFCPVGFFVPDWWDLHDGSTLAGSMHWRPADHEWPTGEFGFVWGCIWGDDSSWKVQFLDLSQVQSGHIGRDDRFGYLKLAANSKLLPSDFIRCSSWEGRRSVSFSVERDFDLATGGVLPDNDW